MDAKIDEDLNNYTRIGFSNLVHSSGVLHHVKEINLALKEIYRVQPGGSFQVMVYNYSSLWLHLYATYLLGKNKNIPNLPLKEAFENLLMELIVQYQIVINLRSLNH